jgi:pimeloyl-ACP methyl ester carboxylesterase
MTKKRHIHPSDVHGLGRLAIDATLGLTHLVEAVHHTIARAPGILGTPSSAPAKGIAGMVYGNIRRATHLVGASLDALLAQLIPLLGERHSSPDRDMLLAALNGVVGDHLAASDNPLAICMHLRSDGQPLAHDAAGRTLSHARGKVLLLVHGLCLNDQHWQRNGHSHGASLAGDLGYIPIYLRYNTGLHISTNGRALAQQLEELLQGWPVPVEELVIVGHSMGGLVSRSACHYGMLAGHTWPQRLRKMAFLGTPHHGAPLERGGNTVQAILGVSPYTAAFARLGKIRSAGITDLRYGSLLDEDWHARDRFAHAPDERRPVGLPDGVQCYTIGATTGSTAGDLRDQLIGDGLVPLHSALGYHSDPRMTVPFPESHQWVGYRMNHLDLLDRRDVYEQLRGWLAA